ncbi:hypothetical protein B6U74_01795 [Candidatus Bathyarchaeota archaeon ex4484_205]|nr:MAG: hypothetical protein B6U74_01795 [Candidatus Bathyarchaeota archaeon ex4484_205]
MARPWEKCRVVRIVNLTQHPITIYDESGENVVEEIPPSGTVARVRAEQPVIGYINDVPVVKTEWGEVEGLPEPEECTVYVVSTLVLQALAGKRDDVVSPDTGPASAVRDETNRIIGVRRFQTI